MRGCGTTCDSQAKLGIESVIMELNEVRQKKAMLEEKIRELMENFRNETGLSITDININISKYVQAISGEYLFTIDVKIEL